MGSSKDLLRSEVLRARLKELGLLGPRLGTTPSVIRPTTLLRSRAREDSAPEIDNPDRFRGRHSEIGPQ